MKDVILDLIFQVTHWDCKKYTGTFMFLLTTYNTAPDRLKINSLGYYFCIFSTHDSTALQFLTL